MKLKAKILTIVLVLATLISIIGVFAIPASAADFSTGTKLYLNANFWDPSSARFAAYFFNDSTGKNAWVSMSDTDGDGIYEVTAPSGTWQKLIFCRMNKNAPANNWDNKWNQTGNLTYDGTKNLFTVSQWDNQTSGWSKLSWTVTGSAGLCGSEWDPSDTNNDMALVNGSWTKEYTGVNKGTYTFKVALGHSWSTGVAYPSEDYSLDVPNGNSKVTIKISNKNVSVKVEHICADSNTDNDHICDYNCGNEVALNDCTGGTATCTSQATCSVCGQAYGTVNASNHDFTGTVKSDDNGTTHSYLCANGCGNYGSETNCSGGTATCTTKATCSVCGQSYGDLAEHSFTEQIQDEAHIKVNGDCQTHNVYWYDCSVCDTSAEENDDSKYYTGTSYGDHNYVDGKCSLCGNYNHEHIPAEAVIENNKNPSCTVNGSYDSVVYCNVSGCGYEISRDHIVVDALGHKDDNNDHTCDNNCGEYQGVHEDSATDKDHVCDYGCGATLEACSDVTGDGDHNCDVCNMADVTDHSYAPATCTAPQTCSECGATTGVKLPHTYDQESTDAKYLKSSATCQSAAVYYKSCSCGASSKDTANEETFTSGSKVNHVFTANGCQWCELSVIYLNPGAAWNDGSGRFAVYFYNNTTNTWASMTDEDKDFVYEVKIPEGEWTNLIFVRMKASINGNDWANRIDNNQTLDLTFTEGKNCYVIEEPWVESQGWKATGSWTSYTYSAPVFSVVGTVHSGGWDETSNVGDMTLNGEGVYEITFKNVAAGNHSFKIAMNHSWDYAWGNNGNNYEFTLETVACSVTIKFNFETKTITHEVDGEHNISSWTEVTVEDVSKHQGVCADCNATIVEDHVYTGDVQKDGTHHWQLCKCGADNKTEHTYSGNWQKDGEKHWKDCDSCGYDGHAGEHNYAGEVQKDGTHHWQTCTCGETNKVEHNYIKTVANETYKATDATCTSPASYYYSCECGAKGTSTFTSGDIADHVFVTHDAVEATCLTAGNKIYYTCENCTNYFTSDTNLKAAGFSYENFLLSEYYIAALGHDMQPVAAQDPTCTAVGWEAYEKCSRCDNSTYVEIPALNHKMDTTPFYRVDGGVLYQVTQCERYATCHHEVKTEASATVTVSNEADLRAVLAAGYNVKLANDITLTEGCIKLTNAGANIYIDMNEKTLTNENVRVNDVVDVLWVATELKVTITGNGSMKALGTEAGKTTCVISATDGAIINIESGSFYSEGCTTIYATRGGEINISGGHYEAADSYFLIDINEGEAYEDYGTIVITGGQFVGFNPANHTNDKPVSTNKIPNGYHAIENEGVYTVDEHNYVAGTPVPVTCTTDGYTLYTCACGDEYKADTVSASGHSFGEVVPKVDATCTEDGREAYVYCSKCETYFFDSVLDKENGGKYENCGVKDSAFESTFKIDAEGHVFTIHSYKAPTCTEAGNNAYQQCTREGGCNLYFAESADKYATNGAENNDDYIINALGHKDENTDHVCDNNCGIPQGVHEDTDKDHACDYGCSETIGDHVDANKDHACDYGCSVKIGEHKDSATDNDHVCDHGCGEVLEECSDATVDGDHNCDVCGKENVSGHDWSGTTCTAPQTCNECGATSGDPMGHKFTTNITCDNDCGTKAAAHIGENYYETFAKAFETATEATESKIVLIQNVNLVAAINVSNNLTIDLNGNSIALVARSGSNVINVEAGATLVFEGNGSVIGDINVADGGTLIVKGGTFSIDVTEYVADGCVAIKDLNGNWVVGEKPTATVNNLGSMIIPEGEYYVYNGSMSGDIPLSFVMQFLADQDEEDMATSPYADWYADFVLKFTGIEEGSFVAEGCYLAGCYGTFGWWIIPVDTMTINNGENYPVMLGVGAGQKYDYICSGVEDFKCALYIPEEILEANPNLEVSLSLHLVDNANGADAAAEALVNGNTHQVVEEVYEEDYFRGPAAQIGTNKYNSLQDAVDAATDSSEIIVIRDNDSKNAVEINKNLTINLDGYAFNGKIIVDGAEVTFKNGSVINADIAISVENGGKLVIKSGYYEGGIECADGSQVQLLGGIYDRDVSDLCSEGYVCSINENGNYAVVATPYIGANGNWYIGDIDTGVKAEGENGANITIVGEPESSFDAETNSTTYTIKFSDGSSVNFTVFHGEDGAPGAEGNGIESIVITDEIVDGKVVAKIITINYTKEDASGNTSVNFKIPCGIDGADGTSVTVEGIEVKETNETSTTYTIKFSDEKSVDFTVLHGTDGEDGNGIKGILVEDVKDVNDKVIGQNVTIYYTKTDAEGNTSVTFYVPNGSDGHTPVISINDDGFWCIDGTSTGVKALGKDGKGIKSINKTTEGLVDTYTIIYTDDTEFEFTVTNGRGIVSISLTSTSADGLVDTYTITYNDGTTSTFTVTNGANGINGIQGEKGDDGHTPVITIQNGKWHIDGVDTGMQAQGVKGETGNGISDISKTGIDGLVDTYTITYTDGTKTTFTVTNGAQGAQGIQGVPGKDGHTPDITIGENGNWFIDGVDTGKQVQGVKGEDGDTPYIGENGNWWIDGKDLGIPATGEDGHTPEITIGENGNWWIDGVDTGVKAEGKDGNDNNKIIIICIGIAALCIITTIVAVATKKFRRPWWILC